MISNRPNSFFQALGRGQVTSTQLFDAVFPGQREKNPNDPSQRELIDDEKGALYVHGSGLTSGVSLHFAPCCSPLPGDRIVGIMRTGEGVEVHVIDCGTPGRAGGRRSCVG